MSAILARGTAAACHWGFNHVVERSDRSEAVYLHVRRREVWYGFRIAAHRPIYRCSADYQQFLLPANGDATAIARVGDRLVEAVRRAGAVVADPQEVRALVTRLERERADGILAEDEGGRTWRWDGRQMRWLPADAEPPAGSRPSLIPRIRLPARAQCAIRHRLNYIARWTFDEMLRPASSASRAG